MSLRETCAGAHLESCRPHGGGHSAAGKRCAERTGPRLAVAPGHDPDGRGVQAADIQLSPSIGALAHQWRGRQLLRLPDRHSARRGHRACLHGGDQRAHAIRPGLPDRWLPPPSVHGGPQHDTRADAGADPGRACVAHSADDDHDRDGPGRQLRAGGFRGSRLWRKWRDRAGMGGRHTHGPQLLL